MRALGYNCKAKVSSPINRETQYIANRFGFDVPELSTPAPIPEIPTEYMTALANAATARAQAARPSDSLIDGLERAVGAAVRRYKAAQTAGADNAELAELMFTLTNLIDQHRTAVRRRDGEAAKDPYGSWEISSGDHAENLVH